ncbi:lantibiotic dehydratase, partial [Yinghuangia sp. YIM S10712]|uniref:lantibiotic dehydratase n=1 Tax=Yinghuangia sp. YIM S10712 TaxID=3436930 RepID=UPI003F53C4AC
MRWLRRVWAFDRVRNAIEHASPSLERAVRALCVAQKPDFKALRGTVRSVERYVRRAAERPMPAGLFGGVSAVSFGERTRVTWGDHHCGVARADAGWLASLVGRLERADDVLRRLQVCVDNAAFVRGPHLVLPYVPGADKSGSATEVTVRLTKPLRAALELARQPVPFEVLTRDIKGAFPATPPEKVAGYLKELLAHRVLITALRAPATEPDALAHLIRVLAEATDAASLLVGELQEIHALLARHSDAPLSRTGGLRTEAARRMRALADTSRHPVAIDVRLDAEAVLPHAVAEEAARAAGLLARVSALPHGSSAWADYHRRFYARYGPGTLVPLLDVVGDNGLGWPDGYPGTTVPERRPGLSRRDEVLIDLAQRAALDGNFEVVLDDALLAQIEDPAPAQLRLPPHVEIVARIDAPGTEALDRGDFFLAVRSVSRAAGVVCGRFLDVLGPASRAELADGLAKLPCGDSDTVIAHLSFPPLDATSAHVARSARVLPKAVSLGEHPDADALGPDDLAVGCDSHRLYLAAPKLGLRVEAWATHALNLRRHTPPLARFITEVSRATCTQVTDFDWGAASACAFLPRVRAGRIILTAAQWKLRASELARHSAGFASWERSFDDWCTQRRLPQRVLLRDGDRDIPLITSAAADRLLLREYLRTDPTAVLEEAPRDDAGDWCHGRAHDVVIPVAIAQTPNWPSLPAPIPQRVISRTHSIVPGTAPVLDVRLHGDPRRQDVILTEYLPALLDEWTGGAHDARPHWWFLRYDDGGGRDHHLRLRITSLNYGAAPPRIAQIGAWAAGLQRDGLLAEMTVAMIHPQTGRWGDGPAYAAADEGPRVFRTVNLRVVFTRRDAELR